jgi:hypothetical protein
MNALASAIPIASLKCCARAPGEGFNSSATAAEKIGGSGK